MNLEEFRSGYPRIFRECVERGVALERDRVVSHLQAGRRVGDLRAALKAIRSGAELTPELMSHYLAAGRNKADLAARLEDDELVEAAIENAKRPTSAHADPQAVAADAVIGRLQALLDTSGDDVAIEDLEVSD